MIMSCNSGEVASHCVTNYSNNIGPTEERTSTISPSTSEKINFNLKSFAVRVCFFNFHEKVLQWKFRWWHWRKFSLLWCCLLVQLECKAISFKEYGEALSIRMLSNQWKLLCYLQSLELNFLFMHEGHSMKFFWFSIIYWKLYCLVVSKRDRMITQNPKKSVNFSVINHFEPLITQKLWIGDKRTW